MHGANNVRVQLSKQANRTNLTKSKAAPVLAGDASLDPRPVSTQDLQPTGGTL